MKRVIRTTKVDVNEILRHDPQEMEKLEMQYSELEVLLRIAVEKQRDAQEAAAEAQIALANATKAQNKFLKGVGTHSNIVAGEPFWLRPFRNTAGHIILESPYTNRDQRLAARAAHKQLAQAGSSGDDYDMWSDGEEGEEDGGNIS